jgi:hypothetical protein
MSKSSTHSSYWMDDNIWEDTDDVGIDADVQPEEANLARIARLSAARRATANFVNILTGRNDIPVQYSSGKQSYTTGNVVVISADENPDNFDSMVGLALHEGSHILLSDFDFLRALGEVKKSLEHYSQLDHAWVHHDLRTEDVPTTVMSNILHPALAKTLPHIDVVRLPSSRAVDYVAPEGSQLPLLDLMARYRILVRRYLTDLQTIMNVIEDRRIDKFVYQNCGGYRPYYDALYARYFFTDEIRKNLKWNPEWRKLTVDNYINHLLFLIHPDFNANALPGLKHLVKMIDLPNIDRVAPTDAALWKRSARFDDMPELWKVANRIYAHILCFTAIGNDPENFDGFSMPEGFADSVQDATDMLPNLDMGPEGMRQRDVDAPDTLKNGKPKKVTYNSKKGKAAVDKVKQVVNGTVKKKKVSKADLNAVDALDAANAEMVDLKGDGIPGGTCMVTRKMNEKMFEQEWFIFGNRWSNGYTTDRRMAALSAGKRMGQILAHKLQVRNDPVMTKNTRLQQGGLDRRLLANLGMDITSVFQKTRVDTFKPAMLHLTIDASGSMSGRKWEKVMTVATALAYVGTKTRSVDVVITVRGGSEMPIVCVVFDSRRDQFTSWNKWAKRLEPNGLTPEGLCYKATMGLITECSATHDVYFINFSDGEPGFSLDARATDARGKKIGRKNYYSQTTCHYSGELAVKHTRQMVQYMTERGVKVLSYFISDADSYCRSYSLKTFRKMYGESAVAVNVENAGEVLRTLNKRLTARV